MSVDKIPLISLDIHELTKCFHYLDEYHSNISSLISNYILSDDEKDDAFLLSTLKKLTDKQRINEAMWFPHESISNHKSETETKWLTLRSQQLLHLLQTDLLYKRQQFKRFGTVLSACVDLQNECINYQIENIPDWLTTMIIWLPRVLAGNMENYNEMLEKCYPGHIILENIKDELDFKTILAIFLERDSRLSNSTNQFLNHLLHTSYYAWYTIIKKNKAFMETVTTLDNSAKQTLINYLLNKFDCDSHIEHVVMLLTDQHNDIREQAKLIIHNLDHKMFAKYIIKDFCSFPAPRRSELVKLIALPWNIYAKYTLEKLLKIEDNKSVVENIQQLLIQNSYKNQQKIVDHTEFKPPQLNIPIPDEWREEASQLLSIKDRYRTNILHDFEQAFIYLETGKGHMSKGIEKYLRYDLKLQKRQAFKLPHFARMMKTFDCDHVKYLDSCGLKKWIKCHPNELQDLRQLAYILEQNDFSHKIIANWLLEYRRWSNPGLPSEIEDIKIWPFFKEHPHYLDSALGLNNDHDYNLGQGILVLSKFPSLPEAYIPVIYEHALSKNKTYRTMVRELIKQHGIHLDKIIAALNSSNKDQRAQAAYWLGELKHEQAVQPLVKRLNVEKNDSVKTAILCTLNQLNYTISDYLSPERLLNDACVGLAKGRLNSLAWFPFSKLPVLKWMSGEKVEPRIIHWWIEHACRLKEPKGNPILHIYVGLLDVNSQQALGLFILNAFIEYNSKQPSEQEAETFALETHHAAFRVNRWSYLTLEDIYQTIYEEKKLEYQNNGIAQKGILGLIINIDGVQGEPIVAKFIKNHYLRRFHIEAVLCAIANTNDPILIQLLLTVARRNRTNSVKASARILVKEIADRNHWTQDELADRTISSLGFEDDGTQIISIENRDLTVKLDHNLNTLIENEQGKQLKSFPAPRRNDDPELVKQAKKDYSSIKRNVKQIIQQQTARLYEAMCVTRKWPILEWQQFLLTHPIMTQLVQRLVWQVSDNDTDTLIKPTAELELIDLDDETHYFSDKAKIQVANITTVNSKICEKWLKKFKEERVEYLFDQFKLPRHKLDEDAQKDAAGILSYHDGWVIKAYTLRKILTQRGYKRGTGEADTFEHYYKDFITVNLRIVITFSGNFIPEDNIPVVLYDLCITESSNDGWFNEDGVKPLHEIPINLLNAAMLDYEAAADKGQYEDDDD